MKNQYYTGTPTSRRQAACPASIKAGDPVLLGKIPAVALDDYQAINGGSTFLLNGSFLLTVHAVSQISPAVGAAIKPGDPLYASGTLDSATNVTYGLTISATSGDTPFGHLDPTGSGILSAAVDTAAIVCLEG